ncbi:hypothetical protein L6164_030455 [Bauhinia variegata]|uniref:Uncharacterized protein n=1 Tax=Bauhinia variegata TaxID=167791 RepID=A0ACB9LBZ1_BAUVA|nr:hypothetical protein L6164_030455 [Bauhinia variegata]
MEREDDKKSSHKNPYTEIEQVNYDFILAIAMQDQERAFTMLSTIESESESESEEDENDSSFNDGDDDDDGADFFRSQPFEGDFGFLEGEESNDDEDMEEDDMDLDVDELTYEELIALGELIGEERRGLSTSEIPFVYILIFPILQKAKLG